MDKKIYRNMLKDGLGGGMECVTICMTRDGFCKELAGLMVAEGGLDAPVEALAQALVKGLEWIVRELEGVNTLNIMPGNCYTTDKPFHCDCKMIILNQPADGMTEDAGGNLNET